MSNSSSPSSSSSSTSSLSYDISSTGVTNSVNTVAAIPVVKNGSFQDDSSSNSSSSSTSDLASTNSTNSNNKAVVNGSNQVGAGGAQTVAAQKAPVIYAWMKKVHTNSKPSETNVFVNFGGGRGDFMLQSHLVTYFSLILRSRNFLGKLDIFLSKIYSREIFICLCVCVYKKVINYRVIKIKNREQKNRVFKKSEIFFCARDKIWIIFRKE